VSGKGAHRHKHGLTQERQRRGSGRECGSSLRRLSCRRPKGAPYWAGRVSPGSPTRDRSTLTQKDLAQRSTSDTEASTYPLFPSLYTNARKLSFSTLYTVTAAETVTPRELSFLPAFSCCNAVPWMLCPGCCQHRYLKFLEQADPLLGAEVYWGLPGRAQDRGTP